jgi:hypothetical protein
MNRIDRYFAPDRSRFHTKITSNISNDDCLYFDLEVQKTAKEVGGFEPERTRKRRVAIAVTLQNECLSIYSQSQVKEFVAQLKQAKVAIGYNATGFDFEVLRGYRGVNLKGIRFIDMFATLRKNAPYIPSLRDLSRSNCNIIRPAVDVIQLWKKRDLLGLTEKCCNDVLAMRQIHQFGVKNGCIKVLFSRNRQPVMHLIPINWQWSRLRH